MFSTQESGLSYDRKSALVGKCVTGQVVNNRDFKTLRHAAAGPVRSLITTPSPFACFNSRCDRATRLGVRPEAH
jgi:hypothetical protein